MKTRLLVAVAALLSQLPSLHAQVQLIPWGHTWNYMHPTTGNLPAGSGATEPNSGATKWYASQADFNASYTGPSFVTAGTGYNAGSGPGTIGYGTIDYGGMPLPPPAEFPAAVATALTTPTSGLRYTGYFRTTFTVPDDGNFYVNPQIRYLLDDGGWVYLDGVPVLRVNMAAGAADDYRVVAASTTNTESHIRTANLGLPAGSSTGGNTAVAPNIAGNATVLQRITTLAPGVHTLAVSVHNQANDSSDITLAVQLVATQSTVAVSGTVTNVTRDIKGTPNDHTDDTIGFTLNVAPTGAVSPAGWVVTGPAGSAAVGRTGAYNTNVVIADIPIGEFNAGALQLVVADADTQAANTTVPVLPQRIIGTDNHSGLNTPIITAGTIPNAGWVFNDATRNVTMTNGGGGSRKVYTSQVIDLSSVPAVQISANLEVNDTSGGTEPADSFVAYLIIDGNTSNPVNLILPHDTLVPDGVLSDNELAPDGGNYVRPLHYIVSAGANSVQIVVEGVNDSPNETMIVRDLAINTAPPTIQAIPGPVAVNNQGTVDSTDDTFGAPVTIEAINLGLSPGWTSNTVPAAGQYSDPQPVTFQGYPLADGPKQFILADIGNVSVTTTVTLTPPPRTLTVSAPTNIVRHENGPGIADDTVTFDVSIAGANGGPGWGIVTTGVSPATGNFGAVTLTATAPLPASPFAVTIADVSYPGTTQTVSVPIPVRYAIGQRAFGAGTIELASDLATAPAPEWINNAALRTLEMNNGGTTDKVVQSEVIDLTAVGMVAFSAKFRATDSSNGSNFEMGDRFKAELIYDVGGVPTVVNLISPWDVGNGAPSTTGTTGGVNGPPDGYLNGYTGAAGTDLENGTVYAGGVNDYNAHVTRDELNRLQVLAAASVDATFNLATIIPANADSVRLVITGAGIGAATPTEHFFVTDVLFTTDLTFADSDGDGMANGYEDANGLNKNDPSDRDLDKDLDGQSNLEEFIAGTAANDPNSLLRIVAYSKVGPISNVTWTSVPGETYRIEISLDLLTWIDIGLVIPAEPSPATETSSGDLDQTQLGDPVRLFLRVRVID